MLDHTFDSPAPDGKTTAGDLIGLFFSKVTVPASITLLSGQMYVNEAFCQLLGYSEEELDSMRWQDVTHPEDVLFCRQNLDALLENKQASARFRKRYIKKDGSVVWAEVHTSRCREASFPEEYLLTVVIDITERMHFEACYNRTSMLFQTFIDSSSDLICLKDDNFRCLYANKALADYLGTEPKQLLGKSEEEFIGRAAAESFRKSDLQVLRQRAPIVAVEELNGRIFASRKFPVQLDGGRTGVGAYIRDVTEEYRQREYISSLAETSRIITECMLKPFADLEEQLDYALREAAGITGSQYGYIYFYDEDREAFTISAWTDSVAKDCGVKEKRSMFRPENMSIWGEAVRQKKAVIVNDFDRPNPLKKDFPAGHVAIHRFMSIPLLENGRVVAAIGFANKPTDYTERDAASMTVLLSGVWIASKKREKEKETEVLLERMQAMINNHKAVMLLLDPVSGRIIEANASASEFYGYTREELLEMTIGEINVLGQEVVLRNLSESLHSGRIYFNFPHRLKSGEIRTVDVYTSPIEYLGSKAMFSIIFDVTAREEIARQNEYLAYHDHLTGIFNRRYFDERFAEKQHAGFPLAVVMGDINGLKLYNDTYGHMAGDAAIRELTDRVRKCISPEDVFARLSGDEFAILLTNMSDERARRYMEDLQQKVNHDLLEDEKRSLTISFGYGIQRKRGDGMDALLKEAEAYLYNRKYFSRRSGRSSMVHVVMETLFARSEGEKQHSERVSALAGRIAAGMGLDEHTVDRARVAGLLHDIGKIGINESILNKKGKFEKSEWEVMKLHAAKGADILERTVEYADIASIVLHHHERPDGGGYPNGLRGESIPLEARIIAVANAFDAMTHDSPYRKAMDGKSAIAELKRFSGTQFDPAAVDSFIRSFKDPANRGAAN